MTRAFARGELKWTGRLIPWRNHVLHVLLPGRRYSVWLFWSADWEFLSYYVNLETPFTRSPVGFDTCDHVLDICVRPDRTWYYKDLDQLEVCTEVGLMSAATAAEVRRDAEQAVALIEAWRPPFDAGLESWRPDAAWPVPELPPGWDGHATEIRTGCGFRPKGDALRAVHGAFSVPCVPGGRRRPPSAGLVSG